MHRLLSYLFIFGLIMFVADAFDDPNNPLHSYVPSNVAAKINSTQSSTSSVPNYNTSQQVNQAQQNNAGSTPLEGYQWPNKNVTIAITSTNSRTKQAFLDAINAWNNTGSIKFQLVNRDQDANIIADDKDLSSGDQDYGDVTTEELGQTDTEYNPNTKILNHAESSLDINKLASSSREYRMWVAEHELGHAIGLNHADQHADSVMVPANPKTGITSMDINAVNSLYQ